MDFTGRTRNPGRGSVIVLASDVDVEDPPSGEALAARGAIQVVEQLDEHDGQALFGFARRLGLSDEQADDAVQELLLRLWTELHRGAAITSPSSWGFRVLYRLAMDQHRLRRRIRLVGDALLSADRQTDSASTSSLDDRLIVWEEVDRLPERQRHVLYLRYRADLPFDEIAHVLGISPSAARSHAAQAIARLRSRLAPGGDDF
jgi:RNA polymerase sigma-70 factor (ECF subfamily)